MTDLVLNTESTYAYTRILRSIKILQNTRSKGHFPFHFSRYHRGPRCFSKWRDFFSKLRVVEWSFFGTKFYSSVRWGLFYCEYLSVFPHSVPLEAFILKNRGRGKDFFICPEASGTGTRAETIDKGRRFSFILNKK